MKKLFVGLFVCCMLASGVTAFAAEEAVVDDDMLIVHEAQGEVMPISEVTEDAAVAAPEGDEAVEEAVEKVVIDVEKLVKDSIVLDGNVVTFAEGMGKITEQNGVVFVPVRAVLEAAGYQVSWSGKEQMVMGANQQTGAMFIMQVDNTLLFYLSADAKEGKTVMEAAPFKNEDEWRTYVSVEALAEAVGYKLGFDAETSMITLGK